MSNQEEQPADSASSGDENETGGENSSDPFESVCAICLGKIRKKAYVNACLHEFCFGCIWDWIKVKLECPLCKQKIFSVIHNVKADDDYSEIRVERTQGRAVLNTDQNRMRLILTAEEKERISKSCREKKRNVIKARRVRGLFESGLYSPPADGVLASKVICTTKCPTFAATEVANLCTHHTHSLFAIVNLM